MRKVLLPAMVLWVITSTIQAEEIDLGCPVGKPEPIPDELKKTFSTDPDVKTEERYAELRKLMEGRRDQECANALRWLIYQIDRPASLRERAIDVLADWNTNWLFYDVDFLANSKVQPPEFRSAAVRKLGLIHRYFPALDKKTYNALVEKAGSTKPFVRDPGILALAEVGSEYMWRVNHPERLQTVIDRWRVAAKDASVESLKVLMKAAAVGELTELAPEVESVAADSKQPVALRVAALSALRAVARIESLAVLDTIAKEEQKGLGKAMLEARPYALVACLGSSTSAAREIAYKELSALGASAEGALMKALENEAGANGRRDLVKTILMNSVMQKYGLKPIDRGKLKRFGENKAKERPGMDTLLVDKASKTILAKGEFVLESGPLEYMVVGFGENAKLHETILAIKPSPTNLCLAMLLCAYEFVGQVRRDGKVNMPKGGGVMLSLEFERMVKTPDGESKQRVRLPIEEFAWNNTTERPMKRCPWAFTGSRWDKTEEGKKFLRAEIEKSIAAIMVDPDALLNTPLDSAEDANVAGDRFGFYSVNRKIVPPRGTECWLVFEPYVGDLSAEDVKDKGERGRAKPDAATQAEPGVGKVPEGPPPVPKHRSTTLEDENETE